MPDDKKPVITYVTPAGEFIYPHLTTPDTKFNADGEYKCKIKVPLAEGQPLIDLIDETMKEQGKAEPIKAKSGGIKYADPPFEIDGEFVTFSAKQKARITRRKDGVVKEMKVNLFDAEGHPIEPGTVNPWGGTIGRLSLELIPYSVALTGVGVSLRLRAAQIIDLKTGGNAATADSYGFTPQQGYVAPTRDSAPPAEDIPDDELPF